MSRGTETTAALVTPAGADALPSGDYASGKPLLVAGGPLPDPHSAPGGAVGTDIIRPSLSAAPETPAGAPAPVGPLPDLHSASGGAVGADIIRPALAAAAAQPQRGCHGEPVTVSLVWPSASPASSASLIPPPAGEVASGVSRPPDDGRGPLSPASPDTKETDRHASAATLARDDRAGEGGGRLIAAPTPDPPAFPSPAPPAAAAAQPQRGCHGDAPGLPLACHGEERSDVAIRTPSAPPAAPVDPVGAAISRPPSPVPPIPNSEFRIPNSPASSADPIAADAARTRDYLRDRGLDAEAWLGSTPALRARSEALARDLFQCFADRSPTLADRAKLLPLVTVAAGTERRWDEDRADLLRYAFEQAALSGAGGSWPYIEGVLQRLRRRGIETLEQAEDYEWGREA